jgi:redox-sensitive bicupin YhaK (pirin superfamily)
MPAPLVQMGDIMVYQPLPNKWTDKIDPFLLLHHWSENFKGGSKQNALGVGPHPHCGISPVTIIFKGGVQHRDSLGNNSEVYSGGVQWINSGKGIIHSERPVKSLAENGGEFEIIQFWINTPAALKSKAAAYFSFQSDEIPLYRLKDRKSTIKIIAGKLFDIKGIASQVSPMDIFIFDLKKGCSINVPVSEKYNTFIYLLKGSLAINDNDKIEDKMMVWFENKGDQLEFRSEEDSEFVLFAGEPINEEVVNYGPFVMNNQSEILTAMRNYQMGKMGILIEEFD